MAIRTRDQVTVQSIEVHVAKPYVPDPNAFLAKVPEHARVRAANAVYEETPVKEIPVDDLATLLRTPWEGDNVEKRYRNRVKGRMGAIRAMCVVTCKAGSPKAVRNCESITCALWPFRLGSNALKRKK